jgi:hypothetical protein
MAALREQKIRRAGPSRFPRCAAVPFHKIAPRPLFPLYAFTGWLHTFPKPSAIPIARW